MDSQKYEQLISNISQELTNNTGLRISGCKKLGRDNLWEGVSGFRHQIDVSIDNGIDVLLIECKLWKSGVRATEFLAHLGRLRDIRNNPKNKNRNIRGALVTNQKLQSGVEVLARYYSEICSAFVVNEEGDIVKTIHTHFIKVPTISLGSVVYSPRIKHSESDVV